MHHSSRHHRLLRLWAICLFATLLARCACTNGEPPTTPPPAAPCGDSCAQGEVCVADRCLPATCASSGCNTSEACLDGQCVARACVGVQCPEGQVCAAGTCQPRQCNDKACGDNQACVEGQCQQVRCVGQSCPPGQACANGSCLPEQCSGQPCATGQVCVDGSCVDRGCVSTTCPPGKQCSGGQCTRCAPGYYEEAGACVPQQANGAVCSGNTQCSSGHCVDGVCCESACDGKCQTCSTTPGSCVPLPPGHEDPMCGAYDCGAAGCQTTCQTDDQCHSDARCFAGQCQAARPLGTTCVQGRECASGQCVDGVCCNSACSEPCDVCNLVDSKGTCVPAPVGTTGNPACTGYRCDGTRSTCPTRCESSAACNALSYCHNGSCVPRQANGATCALAEQCLSSHCVDGRCCNAACTGSCDSCGLTGKEGTCTPMPSGSAGSPSCAPYVCNGTSPSCSMTCTSDSQCSSGQYCANGACQERKTLGATCGGDNQCASGKCVDGVCCNSACDGSCDACNLAGKAGTCSFLPATTQCRGENGVCDAAEFCTGNSSTCPTDQKKPATTVCRAEAGACDAQETCTGSSDACPEDKMKPATTVCRTEAGACDAQETCTGNSSTCPTDQKKPATTVCRAEAGACDAQETCTGSSDACPPDVKKPAATVCRNAAGPCDATETCTGNSDLCPTDGSAPSGTACTSDSNACTRDICNASGQCDHPAVPPGTSCGSGLICTATTQCTAGCWIGGAFYAPGATNPAASCQECNPSVSTASWSNKPVNTTCGTPSPGSWGECGGYSGTCDQTGTQSRSVTTYTCSSAGACVPNTATETQACTRPTDGTTCASPTYGNWTSCDGFSDTCDNTGSQSRSVTTYACSAGNCAGSTSGESQACSRSTTGTPCNDANACTSGDVCNSSGTCGGTPMVCNSPPSQCHEATGSCSGGSCSYAPKPTGSACNDGNACTWGDYCDSGSCVPDIIVACPGGTCVNGTCQCSGGKTYCGGSCTDTNSDRLNCGGCGIRCASGYYCAFGDCVRSCVSASIADSDGSLIPPCPLLQPDMPAE